MTRDAEPVADLVERVLQLDSAALCEDYYYQSLPLCVINAVFSINARYKTVQNVVDRYCRRFRLQRVRDDWGSLPAVEHQESATALCKKYDDLGVTTFADDIYQNHQRTSARGGILKAEAVRQFAGVLRDYSVEHLQDVPRAMQDAKLDAAVRRIAGQGSGISIRYLWMLGGSDSLIKPDRMIMRFLRRAFDREPSLTEAQDLLSRATDLIRPKYPHLTPRLLDYVIWQYETTQAKAGV
jgi:hypothetical protein